MSNELHEAATRLADELTHGRAAIRAVEAAHELLGEMAALVCRLAAVGWDSAKDPDAALHLSERAHAVHELLGRSEDTLA